MASLSSPGLKELTLSANPGVTSKGWGRLAIAVAHSSQLRVLNLDYNPLGKLGGQGGGAGNAAFLPLSMCAVCASGWLGTKIYKGGGRASPVGWGSFLRRCLLILSSEFTLTGAFSVGKATLPALLV